MLRLHQGAYLLRALPQVHDPLMEPGGFQRSRCHLGDCPHSVHRATLGAPQGAEAVLGWRADIGITRVDRRTDARQHEDGDKVRLMECVHMGERGHVASHPEVAMDRIV